MKKRNVFIASVLGLALTVMAGGYAFSAKAFDYNRSSNHPLSQGWEKSSWYQELSDDQKELLDTIRSKQESEMEARRTAMDNAIASGNYESWVALVQQHMGADAPILTQVTAANFATFVEGYKLVQQSQDLMSQAQEKFSSIGLESSGMGLGMRIMKRGKAGGHFGPEAFKGLKATSTVD